MGHTHKHHGHNHTHRHDDAGKLVGKKLLLTIALNFVITAAQIVGGLLANSLALISDALHNFSDAVAVILAYIAFRLGKKPRTVRQTFGFRRSEIMAAFMNALMLIGLSIFLLIEAFRRFSEPGEVNGQLMFWMGLIGLVANAFSVFLLHKEKKENMNVRAAYLHLLGDALTSFAVIVGAGVIYLWEIHWIDPLVTILISLYILIHTISLLKESTAVLMQFTPKGVNLEEVKRELETFPMVANIHHIHAWILTDEHLYFEAHVNMKEDVALSETEKVKQLIEAHMASKYQINHLTLQFEYDSKHSAHIIPADCSS